MIHISRCWLVAISFGLSAGTGCAVEASDDVTSPESPETDETSSALCPREASGCGRPLCTAICKPTSSCRTLCRDGEGELDSCNAYVCGDFDSDGDGLNDAVDNCPKLRNAGQEDCDRDGAGDVCDGLNARYEAGIGPIDPVCGVESEGYFFPTLTAYCMQHSPDQSSCGAPDRVTRVKCGEQACLFMNDPSQCCRSRWPDYVCAAIGGRDFCPRDHRTP